MGSVHQLRFSFYKVSEGSEVSAAVSVHSELKVRAGEALIVAILPDEERGWFEVGSGPELNRTLGRILSRASRLRSQAASWKLIGARNLVHLLRDELLRKGVPDSTITVREAGDFEARLSWDTGKVHIARGPARVLVVDDSATLRKLLKGLIEQDSRFRWVGEASKPSQVSALIRELHPDLVTLDIHMPEMDGVELMKRVLAPASVPTVVVTALSQEEGPKVFEALEAGAVDYVQKPSFQDWKQTAEVIREKLFEAASAHVHASTVNTKTLVASLDTRGILALGASTGGVEALRQVLVRLPEGIPPTVITQHIPPVFSEAFAKRLNELCAFEVREAKNGDQLRPGLALIAPGGIHLRVKKTPSGGVVELDSSDPVNRHRPSVDVMFASVAAEYGSQAIGVLLTGMGADGARSLMKMRECGARTIAQDEASSVVFGMPRAAIQLGAAQEVLALDQVPEQLIRWLSK